MTELSRRPDPTKELRLLLAFFGDGQLPRCEPVEPDQVPDPFRGLLDHHNHMTVTLEEHFRDRVTVHPYQIHRYGELYGRKLDLRLAGSGRIVMTGVMLINFAYLGESAREQIIEQKIPLGRILIEHDILRRIDGVSLLRLDAADPLVARFSEAERETYGRLATIFCDNMPAVDLLEIVTPTAANVG